MHSALKPVFPNSFKTRVRGIPKILLFLYANYTSTVEFEFDENKSLSNKTKHGIVSKRINVEFPEWMIQMLDKESKRLGVTRQSIIKVWIAEKLREVAQ